MATAFEIKPLTPEAIPELAQVITAAFCRRNLITVALKPDETAYASCVQQIATSCLEDGFSEVVYDTKTGKLIAGELRATMATKDWHEDALPEIKPIYDLLDKLKRPPCETEADPETVLSVMMAATLSPEEGGQKGIYVHLARSGLKMAKERDVKYVVSELTSSGTQHVFLNKLGYTAVDELTIAEAGIPQFKDVPGTVVLALLDLSS